jgi:hypothetical protein
MTEARLKGCEQIFRRGQRYSRHFRIYGEHHRRIFGIIDREGRIGAVTAPNNHALVTVWR